MPNQPESGTAVGLAALSPVLINGRRLPVAPDADPAHVRECAWAELLRQRAVREGLLADEGGEVAPIVDAGQQQAIERLLARDVVTPAPGAEACARYYEANRARYRQGQSVHLRHILFAVTPGVPVQALARHAESVLLSLLEPAPPQGRFEALARQWSNCPSGASGGDLGRIGPGDCVPELARLLFHQDGGAPDGIQPRLAHTRFGLHILDVGAREPGVLPSLAELHARIASELALRAQATALRHYLMVLVGEARIEGISLDGADTPLLQ